MNFVLLPVIDKMLALYAMPADRKRFDAYLQLLQGDTKDDLAVPVGGYNPMAKAPAIAKLQQLKDMDAEGIMQEALDIINAKLEGNAPDVTFTVALNLADDVAGGWTNRYTTDLQSKFRTIALVKRHFVTPHLWTGETYTEELIIARTQTACYRAMYIQQHGQAKTLGQMVDQELYVQRQTGIQMLHIDERSKAFLQQNSVTENMAMIYNFLYGDAAADSLGYSALGLQGIIKDIHQ